MSFEWDFIRHLRWRVRSTANTTLGFKNYWISYREELFFSQSFGISYGSHYGMNSAIKQQGHLPLLCFYKTTVVHFVSSFLFTHQVLCRLLLVVKITAITSLQRLFSPPFSSFVMWPLVDIFASYPSGVSAYVFTWCHRFILPFVHHFASHLVCIFFHCDVRVKWQKRMERTFQSLLTSETWCWSLH